MNRKAIATALAMMFAGGAAGAGDDPAREVQALKGAQYPLYEAIRIAEKRGGGPAIDAEFDAKNGGGQYEIKVLSAGGKKVQEFKIDARTGEVVEAESEPFETLFTRLNADLILKAPIDLATAAVTAQKTAGGTALEAEVDSKGSTVVYNVRVAKGSAVEEIRINAAGKVASAE